MTSKSLTGFSLTLYNSRTTGCYVSETKKETRETL
jgi:hypothetical protein